jgi:hypothetical protein
MHFLIEEIMFSLRQMGGSNYSIKRFNPCSVESDFAELGFKLIAVPYGILKLDSSLRPFVMLVQAGHDRECAAGVLNREFGVYMHQ